MYYRFYHLSKDYSIDYQCFVTYCSRLLRAINKYIDRSNDIEFGLYFSGTFSAATNWILSFFSKHWQQIKQFWSYRIS